jgi:hypothetical protein
MSKTKCVRTNQVVVAENREKFTADQITKAFEGRYGKIVVSIDVNDTIISIAIPDRIYKMFKKIAGKNYEEAIIKIVHEDFSDCYDQVFEEGIWVE